MRKPGNQETNSSWFSGFLISRPSLHHPLRGYPRFRDERLCLPLRVPPPLRVLRVEAFVGSRALYPPAPSRSTGNKIRPVAALSGGAEAVGLVVAQQLEAGSLEQRAKLGQRVAALDVGLVELVRAGGGLRLEPHVDPAGGRLGVVAAAPDVGERGVPAGPLLGEHPALQRSDRVHIEDEK